LLTVLADDFSVAPCMRGSMYVWMTRTMMMFMVVMMVV